MNGTVQPLKPAPSLQLVRSAVVRKTKTKSAAPGQSREKILGQDLLMVKLKSFIVKLAGQITMSKWRETENTSSAAFDSW